MASNNDVTTTQTSAPSNGMVDTTLTKLLGQLNGSIDKGAPDPFDKSLYAGVGPNTQHGWQNALSAAQNPQFKSGLDSAFNFNNKLLGNGGLNPIQKNAFDQLGGIGKAYQALNFNGGLTPGMQGDINKTNATADKLGQLATTFGGPGIMEKNLGGVASGQYLNGANPYFEKNLATAEDRAGAAVNADIGGSGRYGSNVHVNQLARSIGDLDASARGAQYETERDRQFQANQGIGSERATNRGLQLGALGQQLGGLSSAFGMGQQGTANRFGALGALTGIAGDKFGMGQTGIGNAQGAGANLASLFQTGLLPSATQGAVGGQQDADKQAALLGQKGLWDSKNNNQTDWLAKLSSIFSGQAPFGGTQSSETKPGTPLWQTLLSLGGQYV